jgi:electron transfer flavoprotein alpha subunit
MKIAVCVKWVPALARMRFDPETRRIVREGVPHELNGLDQLAIQRAVELKASHGAEISVYTMGPPQARQGLVQCLAWGADHVFHIVDRAFAGSDTLATSRALSLALLRDSYDLVLFGAHSLDAETGQVGPQVAEFMSLPQVTGVQKLDIGDDGTKVVVERQLDEGVELVECRMPCVIAVTEGVAPETFPHREALREAADSETPEISATDLSEDLTIFGDRGSPTYVSEIRIVESSREQRVLEEMEPEAAARVIVDYIKGKGLLKPEARQIRRVSEPAPSVVRATEGPGVWVIAEVGRRGVLAVTRELLSAAQPVADAVHGHVAALLLGGPDVGSYARELGHFGADVVYVAAGPELAAYTTDAYATTLTDAIQTHNPYAVLLPSTVNGRDLAPRVAARLQLGLTGDCVGLEVDGEGRLVQLKPAFGGNVLAPIFSKTIPNMATVRPGLLTPLQAEESRQIPVEPLPVFTFADSAVRVMELRQEESVDVGDLENAWAVVAVGMGLGGAENLPVLDPLLQILDAEVVCTRDVVEAGWLPRQRQVGITGRSVAPALYIGVGVRGDFYHTVGFQRAGTVVAINNNRRATIFRQSDIGVVGNWQAIVPALIAQLKKEMSQG